MNYESYVTAYIILMLYGIDDSNNCNNYDYLLRILIMFLRNLGFLILYMVSNHSIHTPNFFSRTFGPNIKNRFDNFLLM